MTDQQPTTIIEQAQETASKLAVTVADWLNFTDKTAPEGSDPGKSGYIYHHQEASPNPDLYADYPITHSPPTALHRRESWLRHYGYRSRTLTVRYSSSSLPIPFPSSIVRCEPHFGRQLSDPEARFSRA